jgi:hypothetical protein
MLLRAVYGIEPAFASRDPQFISRREVRGRVVEGADSNFDLVGAVDNRKHGRAASGAKVTVVGGLPPASGLSGHRYFVRRPHSKKIANRAGLPSTHQTVTEAHPEGLAPTSNLTRPQLQPPVRFRMSHFESKNFWVHGRPCEVNIGLRVFDPGFIASLFRLGDARTCERPKYSRNGLLGG